MRSLLATTIGLWHSVHESTLVLPRHAAHLRLTCQVLEAMGRAQWLQPPWDMLAEVVGELAPKEIVKVLMAVWDTLLRFPPQAGPYSPLTVRAEAARLKPLFVDNINLTPLFVGNIASLAPYYSRFFPGTEHVDFTPA
ncbi:hypothetical protein T484DRAFT_1862658 [Baffinella frigidus]|nr:hypothetical protein T484DRAFT_1862658 [Cryptophyta sp. CCMP2293]